ncbi:hypothetical protein ATK17_2240 [Branchiibius hedensis]|uniref:DUF7847 domain-containing protein n=1 Tax=Branchiibius hedensis TaxID=672460 RepID=A0A2Y8ZUF4_9MICO|nr:hypothetical protein [Branchiibius hedensis]PWJ26096.1 hypothetical protein ATK17_2240 [Branchiibius hedensis]SSA34908.1 hypothetical protein SAMN04489750_2240 [Branchiibius hedensis]
MSQGWTPPEGTPPQGGYGTPQWGQQAPMMPYQPIPLSPKPGVIPLRPLKLGDIWEGAVATIRGNPTATIGLSLVVTLIAAIPSVLAVALLSRASLYGGVETDARGLIAQAGGYVLDGLAGIVLAGMLVFVLAEAVLGRRCSIGAAWQGIRSRILPLIGLALIFAVTTAVVGGLLVGLIVLLANTLDAGVVIAIAIPLTLAIGAGVVFVWTRWSLAAPAVVLERAGPIAALKRSWALSRGQFWRILGIEVLTRIVVGFVSGLATTPVAFLAFGLGGAVTLTVTTIWSAIIGGVLAPFSANVTGLLYIDQRIRKEALDVTLMAAAS